ncbi:MAG: TldD/PmbA family protein [Candidatus Parvarchaeota archaeon]|nr:TldD/PmbA family protein [Candidatus Jingweiarchaeum tengchongense]MCW1297866.1 TldD/PmbA family protein [Candidatus Jingweiarchaeum tengchongense]MCW1299877.1 TldD/PmbA family protein [Candidatus Jingweiarchaeum tengchongense]MCW1304153.1 TldD/PmbA family protein [Candidatus Jingweiarchaeum tengchongense]MCW1305181.1 TldD/PmbA family protein [Candidatus Jingweiarchaeum tengchongense]
MVDEDFLRKIVREGEKYGMIEVYVTEKNTTTLDFEKNEIDSYSNKISKSLSIRVTKKRKFGFSQTSDLHKWKECLLRAVKVMRASNDFDVELKISEKQKARKVICYDKKIDKLDFDDILKICFNQIDEAKNFDNRIEIQKLGFSKGIDKEYFMNSNNVFFKNKYSSVAMDISVKTENSIGQEIHTSRTLKNFLSFELGKNAAELCIKSMNPIRVKSQKLPVIFDYHSISELFSIILIPHVCADRVQIGRSLLKGKIGEKVADEKLTIIDDPLIDGALVSQAYDAEGTVSMRKKIIENGVLRNFLYDILTASREKKESTGNCDTLAIRPSVYATNFIIKSGGIKEKEMIEDSKKALFVKFVIGTHLINQISGDFSLGIENSFLIEKGRWIPIKRAMISGNFFNMLNKIEQIGKEKRQENEVLSPVIKFKEIQLIT